MTLRRFPLRRAWIAGLLLAASLVGTVVTPGIVHVHTDGDVPHTHSGSHSHVHSHGHGRSHRHSHGHSHDHSHARDGGSQRDFAPNRPHVHVSFLGWEFTLTLSDGHAPLAKSGPPHKTHPALPKPFVPSAEELAENTGVEDVPLLPAGFAFIAADESMEGGSFWTFFVDCWKPAPIPGRIEFAPPVACGGRIVMDDEDATAQADPPPVPPPRA